MFFKSKGSTFDWLIVGLGNPGLQYAETRHNAGFMVADRLAEKYGCNFNKNKHNAIFGECNIKESRVLLAKPQTYMNLSGKAVVEIANFYKIPIENIIVIFDDISLDVGRIRVRRKGSHGGHNGMKDIIELMGSDEIARIKVGVGKKPHPEYDLKDWVLGKFPKDQQAELQKAIDNACDAVGVIVSSGVDKAMNRYNG
ncbi:MAG: aminoacyl-tRNA hydrolase [Ruminococcaceae bacterium]|nr:aminoacyl-tRNA hydrolase [Oscillospiraceae bacterium]